MAVVPEAKLRDHWNHYCDKILIGRIGTRTVIKRMSGGEYSSAEGALPSCVMLDETPVAACGHAHKTLGADCLCRSRRRTIGTYTVSPSPGNRYGRCAGWACPLWGR